MRETSDHLASAPTGYPGAVQGSGALGDPVGRSVERSPDLTGIGEGG